MIGQPTTRMEEVAVLWGPVHEKTVVNVCARARPSPRRLGFHEPTRGQNARMNITHDEPPGRPKKTALQQIQEQFERQMRPLRQIQEMPDLVKRYQLEGLTRQFEPHRQIQEMLERSVVPKHVQEIIDGSSIAAQAKRMMEQYFPKDTFASLGMYNDTIRRAAGLTIKNEAMRRAAGLDSINDIAKHYARNLKPISVHQEMLEKLRRQAFGGLSAVDFARQLEEANPAIRAMEEAKKSFDHFWPTFREIDFSQFEASEIDEQETKQAAESITQVAAEQESFQEAVASIVLAIQAQQNPTVQLVLWLFFRKVMDWLIAGAIGAAMGHYAPVVLGESPQAAKKAVQENARTVVGSPQLLVEYRYVSAKVLIVRQNPRARSPEVGRLSFGKAVKLLKKEKDFALVLWTDKESGAEIQGWVFSRHLGKFN